MTGPTAALEDLIAELARQRAAWLTTAVAIVECLPFVAGAWLCGSLGRGTGDGFSDIDLVVAVDPRATPTVMADPYDGLYLPKPVLYTRPKPRNAPAGGAYLAVGVDVVGLPLLVDLYLWPQATAAAPAGARVLYERDRLPRTDLGFLQLLERYPAADRSGGDPDAPGTVLMLVQLAAKYLARADTSRLAGITHRLGLPADADAAVLRETLAERVDLNSHPDLRPPADAVLRLLALAAAVRA